MADKERIVVKIGTSSLIQENGRVNLASIDRLAFTLACVNNQGYQPILVSSGAIGVGLASLGLTKRPAEIARQQALASIGQTELMRIYIKWQRTYCLTRMWFVPKNLRELH